MIDPARIQARGALIAYRDGGPIVAASENAQEFFGAAPLGADPLDIIGREGLHAVRNMASVPVAAERSVYSARVLDLDLYTHIADGAIVVEAERSRDELLPSPYEIERDVALIAANPGRRIELLKTLSGFRDVSIEESGCLDGFAEGSGPVVMDDLYREPVRILGEVPRLDHAWLRLPDDATKRRLAGDGVTSAVVLRCTRDTVVMTHPRPRMPSHRTRLVLFHLALLP